MKGFTIDLMSALKHVKMWTTATNRRHADHQNHSRPDYMIVSRWMLPPLCVLPSAAVCSRVSGRRRKQRPAKRSRWLAARTLTVQKPAHDINTTNMVTPRLSYTHHVVAMVADRWAARFWDLRATGRAPPLPQPTRRAPGHFTPRPSRERRVEQWSRFTARRLLQLPVPGHWALLACRVRRTGAPSPLWAVCAGLATTSMGGVAARRTPAAALLPRSGP